MRPLLDQRAKEGKDKKVVFDAGFSKPNCKPKWYFRKDVSDYMQCVSSKLFLLYKTLPFSGIVYGIQTQIQK